MPAVISSRIKVEDLTRSIRIKFYPKVYYLRLIVFLIFIYIAVLKEFWLILAFIIILILLTFKGKMIQIDKNSKKLCVFHFLFFIKAVHCCFFNRHTINVSVSRYKPLGIIWESKEAYAYQIRISDENKKIFICNDNNKSKLEGYANSIIQLLKSGRYNNSIKQEF